MSKIKVYFYGFLTNTNSTILNINLENGFKIESFSIHEAVNFFKLMGRVPSHKAYETIAGDYPIYNYQEKKIYFVKNSFEVENIRDKDSYAEPSYLNIQVFDKDFITKYLKPTISLLRLFKEGNICMPLEYFFYHKNGVPEHIMNIRGSNIIQKIQEFELENSEIEDLYRFIQNTTIPFEEKSLQLSFESFEFSYHSPSLILPFLLLMMSLESLFNPENQGELTFRISRNLAVLIGRDILAGGVFHVTA